MVAGHADLHHRRFSVIEDDGERASGMITSDQHVYLIVRQNHAEKQTQAASGNIGRNDRCGKPSFVGRHPLPNKRK
jgi:hypothetical protein